MVHFLKNRIFNKKVFLISVLIMVFIFSVGAGLYLGYSFGYKKGEQNPQTLIIKGVADLENGQPKSVDFSTFWETWQVIKEKYVEPQKADNQILTYGAISGLINSLNDPYSVFMPPSDAKKFGEDISGEFSGIGAEIGIKNNQLLIIAPLKDTPAERAGIKAGDKILKIDDTDTFGLSVEDAVKLIRGEKGTNVTLTILREGWDNPKEISITRGIIQVPTLDWKMIDSSGAEKEGGDIAYFHLYNFYENAPFMFYQKIVQTAMADPKGIILDLRGNPGGYLEAAVNIAGWFLEPGDVVVSEEFSNKEKNVFKATGTGLFSDIPMVILIDQGSASASEILAGALRDINGVKLVGKKSFGKGTVQELIDLKDGSSIKITVAYWLTPKGGIIEKNGLEPDYDIETTKEDAKIGKDSQLQKAIEILEFEINK